MQNLVDQSTPVSEELKGLNGGNYTGDSSLRRDVRRSSLGVQTYTKLGYYCADWGDASTLQPMYNSTNYPDSDLRKNYCRNPFQAFEMHLNAATLAR